MPTNYTLKAIIPPEQVAALKATGFSLFFGKVVQDALGNSDVNVVWDSNSQFIHENTFEWQETFSIAGAATNTTGALASAATAIQPIGLGQTVTIDKDGNLGPATGASGSGPITFANNDGKINFSALLYCTGPKKTTTQAPVYVSVSLQAGFKVELTPIETVAVWFSSHKANSTIIANASNTAYNVTYLNSATAHTIAWVQQAGGEWKWQTTA